MQSQALPIHRIHRLAAVALCAALLLMGMGPQKSADLAADTDRLVSVIVQGVSGTAGTTAVESVGGEVIRDLWLIDSVAANVPESRIDELEANPNVRYVSPNSPVQFHGKFDGTTPSRVQKVVRADKLWNQGVTGTGIGVAVLDTGIYNHPDLAGRIVHCEDFTVEALDPATKCQDTFGHGTFMAGLIGGSGASSSNRYKGSAPNANLIAIKVAGYDGSTDISQVMAGIQWAVAHKAEHNIRVLNLSLGTDASQDYRTSPMNYAVERAWQAGIAVVVSAGNSGPNSATIMKPGDDPFVITVGASNDQGTDGVNDDVVAAFSSRGPTRANGFAKPDLVSPGVHTVSLASPGSNIDDNYGDHARFDNGYFRGTGTSMSTATVSGVIALLLSDNPNLTPDQVKARLVDNAKPMNNAAPNSVGAGLVDAEKAWKSLSLRSANVGIMPSNGLGSIALDRGTLGTDIEVVTPAGAVLLAGEFKAQTNPSEVSVSNPGGLVPWVGTQWRTEGWDGTQWRAEDWAGTQWRGTQWRATVWDGTQWRGTQWRNEDWEGTQWRDEDWDGTQWRATNWQSRWYAAAWD